MLFGVVLNFWVSCLCLLKLVVFCFLYKVPAAALNSTAVLMPKETIDKILKTAIDVLQKAVQTKLLHLLGMCAKISILISHRIEKEGWFPQIQNSLTAFRILQSSDKNENAIVNIYIHIKPFILKEPFFYIERETGIS